MPPVCLSDIPSGSDVFLDTNVVVYALCGDSEQCVNLMRRCASEDVCGVLTLDVVNDVTHKLMLREARDAGVIPRPRADLLSSRLDKVPALTRYWQQVQHLLRISLIVLEVEVSWLYEAQALRSSFGLLTGDSVIAAAMTQNGLAAIASADSDFDRLPDICRYVPTDLPV